jgi:ankyrin repeat protein
MLEVIKLSGRFFTSVACRTKFANISLSSFFAAHIISQVSRNPIGSNRSGKHNLLERESKWNTTLKDKQNLTPVHFAAYLGRHKFLELFLKKRENIEPSQLQKLKFPFVIFRRTNHFPSKSKPYWF